MKLLYMPAALLAHYFISVNMGASIESIHFCACVMATLIAIQIKLAII